MKSRITKLILILITSVFALSCSDDNSKQLVSDPNVVLYTKVLDGISNELITTIYTDLNESAIQLNTATNLLSVGDQNSLNEAKNAWRETRMIWEQSQAITYGAVVSAGISPAVDAWPIDREVLDTIINSEITITPEIISVNPKTRGFHLFELLLWGEDGNKTADQLTLKELEILKAAARDLQNNTQILSDGWNVDNQNFGSNFINAGQSGSIYVSQTSALEDIVNGMITAANEVSGTKIGNPYSLQIGGGIGVNSEESAISNNSKSDFINNIRSIENIYLGKYAAISIDGIQAIVLTKDETLDTDIKSAISDALISINAIPGTFSNALVDNPTAVENALNKTADLKIILETRLLPFISKN